jgi:hypothetical protein
MRKAIRLLEIKSRRIRWAASEARVREMRNA